MTTNTSSRASTPLEEIEAGGPFVYDLTVDGYFFNVNIAQYAETVLSGGEAEELARQLEEARVADDINAASDLAMTLNFSDLEQFVTDNWSATENPDRRFEFFPYAQDFSISINEGSVPGDLEWDGSDFLMWVNLGSLEETSVGFAARLEQERTARAAAE